MPGWEGTTATGDPQPESCPLPSTVRTSRGGGGGVWYFNCTPLISAKFIRGSETALCPRGQREQSVHKQRRWQGICARWDVGTPVRGHGAPSGPGKCRDLGHLKPNDRGPAGLLGVPKPTPGRGAPLWCPPESSLVGERGEHPPDPQGLGGTAGLGDGLGGGAEPAKRRRRRRKAEPRSH